MEIDRDVAMSFVKKRSLGVLATMNDETPMTSAIYYVVANDDNIRFITRNTTNKFKNITQQPNVGITVTDPFQPIAVNLTGTASIIERDDEIESTLHQISKVSSGGAASLPVVKLRSGDFVVIEVAPKRIQYTDFTQPFEKSATYVFDV